MSRILQTTHASERAYQLTKGIKSQSIYAPNCDAYWAKSLACLSCFEIHGKKVSVVRIQRFTQCRFRRCSVSPPMRERFLARKSSRLNKHNILDILTIPQKGALAKAFAWISQGLLPNSTNLGPNSLNSTSISRPSSWITFWYLSSVPRSAILQVLFHRSIATVVSPQRPASISSWGGRSLLMLRIKEVWDNQEERHKIYLESDGQDRKDLLFLLFH